MEKYYELQDVCKELNISTYTLCNWYRWEKKMLNEKRVDKPYLPEPFRVEARRGKPRVWNTSMLNQLRKYKESMLSGRHGIYGRYTNPNYVEKKGDDNVTRN